MLPEMRGSTSTQEQDHKVFRESSCSLFDEQNNAKTCSEKSSSESDPACGGNNSTHASSPSSKSAHDLRETTNCKTDATNHKTDATKYKTLTATNKTVNGSGEIRKESIIQFYLDSQPSESNVSEMIPHSAKSRAVCKSAMESRKEDKTKGQAKFCEKHDNGCQKQKAASEISNSITESGYSESIFGTETDISEDTPVSRAESCVRENTFQAESHKTETCNSTTVSGEVGDASTQPDSSSHEKKRKAEDCESSRNGSSPKKSDPTKDDDINRRERTKGFDPRKLDNALHTLKSELMALREQDLQLLRQLIHIDDNIRRLKRTRCLQAFGRTSSCGALGAPHRHFLSLESVGENGGDLEPKTSTEGGGRGVTLGGQTKAKQLLRQRSEPKLIGMSSYNRRASVLNSTSSFETIDDADEADSLYGSSTDLDTPTTTPVSPLPPPLPVPRTHLPSLSFTQEEVWKGESSYGDILTRNVRLWKWSIARDRESGVVEGQGYPCVL